MPKTHLLLALVLSTAAVAPGIAHAFGAPSTDAPQLEEGKAQRFPSLWIPLTEEESEANLGHLYAPGGAPLPIYLNRWGGTYYGGPNDSRTNHSSIVPWNSATVGPFPGTDAQWNVVLECVRDQFAPFNVYVTDYEPVEGDYVEAVVGGTPDQIGQSFGVGGVAPYDAFGCNIIPNAVVYAFAGVYPTNPSGLQAVCETATQEIAHAFSLDHELLCEDPMTYLDGCGAKSFQDVTAPCGEFDERECTCGSPSGQNSVQALTNFLGENLGVEPPPPPADFEEPVVTLVSPESGTTHLYNDSLEIKATATDDAGLVTVQLLWETDGVALHCPGDGENWTCSKDGDVYTWELWITTGGLREFSVKARDVVGNEVATETRWVWLGQSLDETRPEDDVPPEVTIISPHNYTNYAERTSLELVATAYDADTGIREAYVTWESPFGVRQIGCPLEGDDRFGCTFEGGTYFWTLFSGRSDRAFTVTAVDFLGNETTSDPVYITVGGATDVPPAEDELEFNDTWDFATPLSCDTSYNLLIHRVDPDWFLIDAPVGHKVNIELGGETGSLLEMFVHVKPTSDGILSAGEEGLLSWFQPESGARLRVQPTQLLPGSYSIAMSCEEPPPPPPDDDDDTTPDLPIALPFTCSHTGTGSGAPAGLVLGLAVLGLVIRRRRR